MTAPLPKSLAHLVEENLREVPDFPEAGVLFRDMTPMLANGPAFKEFIDTLADHYRGHIDAVAGLESRGFPLAAPLAVALEIPMIMIRKAGKLPGPVLREDYTLEYATASMELQPFTVEDGQRILVIDDVLATGGTANASVRLIERAGGQVEEILCLMELRELDGRAKLGDVSFQSVIVV
ncbi:MAG: adenine phosphoribosyltransferase [Actinomycetaceae bacterium]|nr:adenine phosphoribosyltransferase [Actinomycetaceae bacterium]